MQAVADVTAAEGLPIPASFVSAQSREDPELKRLPEVLPHHLMAFQGGCELQQTLVMLQVGLYLNWMPRPTYAYFHAGALQI